MQMAIKNIFLLYTMDRKRQIRAQSILEYAILIGVVTIAIMAMSLYVRRAIQANLKIIEYQVNLEVNTTN